MRITEWVALTELIERTAHRVTLSITQNIRDQVSEQNRRLDELETRMSAVDDAIADLNDATNEVATELDALEQQVAGLDSDAAAKIKAAADRLRGLAADPENPVPPVEPPADGG